MKTNKIWYMLLGRFFMLFNPTSSVEGPSKKSKEKEKVQKNEKADVIIQGEIMPHKETVMLDEVRGYTKTKVRIQKVLSGCHKENETIEICEPYYEGYYRGKKCMIVHEDYEPLHIGKVYTLLLTHESAIMESQHISKSSEEMEKQLFYQVS